MSAAENVIGGIIIGSKDAYWAVAGIVKPEDFPTPYLSGLFRICRELAESATDLDIITAMDAAKRDGLDADELGQIANRTASAANIRAYAELVKRDALERRVRAICAQGAKSGDIATVQASLTALLTAQPAHAVSASEAMNRMWKGVMARYESDGALPGISTGYPLLDEMTGGLQKGRVYGIGGRTKMGKTMLAMNICANAALAGTAVGIWSLEMGDEELMQRMTCAAAGVESVLLQRPKLLDQHDTAMSKINEAIKALKSAPLRISDRTDVSIEQIEAQARQMHASGDLEVLCIDHIGLLRLPKMDRHDLSVGHATRRIKIIAKELHIPVIEVFQLNRGSESNNTVRPPRPSDARDSGSIEQDLDAMLLLHRPSYYDKRAPTGLRLDLALQRNGSTGLIHFGDELSRCRFTGGDVEWKDAAQQNGQDNDL